MSLILIIFILVVGIVFMFIEIFLIPGTSLLTLLGSLVISIGVYLGYSEYGQTTGNIMFASCVISVGLTLYIGYKRVQSKKWALQSTITGKMNDDDLAKYKIGAVGKTFTALRPEGKAIFENDDRITVYSMGSFIDKDTQIEIIKIDYNKIYVKPVNQ